MKDILATIRISIFYIFYVVLCIWFGITGFLFLRLMPVNARFNYITLWNHSVVFLAKILCGVKYKISGKENIPKQGSYVVLAKHQSQWETFILLLLFKPVSIILKQELLELFAFGHGLQLLKPIAIDRNNPKQALKKIQSEGIKRLKEDNMPVLIFPEGTRTNPGETSKYARSGAALAIAAEVPVILVSHNAGYFWPADKFIKNPGTIEMEISPPIDVTGKTALEVTREAQEWIESRIKKPEVEV